jgi:hypothetical protein
MRTPGPSDLPERQKRPVSRRSLLAAAFGTGAGLALLATKAPAEMKISQAAVGYQDRPSGERQCSGCMHFRPPNQCQIVTGAVSPQGWCRLFAPATGQASGTHA